MRDEPIGRACLPAHLKHDVRDALDREGVLGRLGEPGPQLLEEVLDRNLRQPLDAPALPQLSPRAARRGRWQVGQGE